MTIVGGSDVHKKQITFDYVDNDGLVRWGQIRLETRKTLRQWLSEHCPNGEGEFALEGCAGYVCEEVAAAGVAVHLGDPAETAAARGPKRHAKTDRADARLLRTLLLEGRFPESWVLPAHVLEMRTLGRLYGTLMDQRRAWQQRIHAQLFHQGCPPITALPSQARRDALACAELSAAGRQYVDTALRRVDELSAEIEPLRAQLVGFARRQAGCRVRQARHYAVGWLCTAIIWAEIGNARRFGTSDQLVRFAGLDVPVYSSDRKRSAGHLSRQGSPHLRCAAVEAAKCAAHPGSPDYPYYRRLAARPGSGKSPTPAVERKILRHCCHTCVSLVIRRWRRRSPKPRRSPPDRRYARALPTSPLMPAAGSRHRPAATPVLGGRPRKNEPPHPLGSPQDGHPIHHHVAGPSSVDPDKARRRHARRHVPLREAPHGLNHHRFAPVPADRVCGGSFPASRFSSSLRCGRSTSTPTAIHRLAHGPERGQTKEKTNGSTFTRGSQHR